MLLQHISEIDMLHNSLLWSKMVTFLTHYSVLFGLCFSTQYFEKG